MVSSFMPEISSALYHGSENSMGDSIRIGESFGAQTGFSGRLSGTCGCCGSWINPCRVGYCHARSGPCQSRREQIW